MNSIISFVSSSNQLIVAVLVFMLQYHNVKLNVNYWITFYYSGIFSLFLGTFFNMLTGYPQ